MKMLVTRTNQNKRQLTFNIEDGVLHVVAPYNFDIDKIVECVNTNQNWLQQQLHKSDVNDINKTPAAQNQTSSRHSKTPFTQNVDIANAHKDKNITDKITLLFSSKACLLCGKFIEVKAGSAKKTNLQNFVLYVNEKQFDNKENRTKAVKSFIKKVATQFLSLEISKFGCSVSLCPSKIEIKALKGDEWVDCSAVSSEKRIIIDYRTIQLPVRLQRYLIIHSFSHFFEAGHTLKFWNIVSNYLPDYKNSMEELSKYRFIKDI